MRIVVGVGRVAAIFDLDRTLLRGASGRLINQALEEVGLRTRKVPGEGLLYRSYELFGESPLGMALARAAALAVRGWPVDRLGAAGHAAADLLFEDVASYVPALLHEHRKDGHLLVLATTTPEPLVRPLADRLGIDEVVATCYASAGGVFTGRLEGGFVWGPGKLSAVRKRTDGHDVALSDSFAYSDSINDFPLLNAVGNPRAVNPDLALHAVAVLRRWPILHLDVPPGVPTLGGMEAFDVTRLVMRPELFPYARFDIEGVGNIPDRGAFILASNHRSYFDVAALALVVAAKGRPTRFLGKSELFDAPVVGQLARAFGGIPVERSGSGANALEPAERVLRAGEGLVILPQGTIPRGRAFFDPVLSGKTGTARLAASTGAPVVPVGLWNTEAVWPRSARLPRLAKVVGAPRVRVRLGAPVEGLERRRDSAVSDTEKIMAAIAALLPEEAGRLHEPSEEELVRTYPKGKVGEERAIGVAPAPPARRPSRPQAASKAGGSAPKAPGTGRRAAPKKATRATVAVEAGRVAGGRPLRRSPSPARGGS
jgi:putative phosphoserine phosphatase/1-acylglycerol-3-phosphate O-acyltransferase